MCIMDLSYELVLHNPVIISVTVVVSWLIFLYINTYLEEEMEIGMLGIISEWTLDIVEELCACCIDWQKAFDHGNLINTDPKRNGIDWCRIRLMSKLYVEQCESVTGPRGGNRCEDGKLSSTRMLFVTDCYLTSKQVPYEGSCWRVWRLQNRRTTNSPCEIFR